MADNFKVFIAATLKSSLSLRGKFDALRVTVSKSYPGRLPGVMADHHRAQGYAWGWEDGSNGQRDTDDTINFAYAYGILSAAYALEARHVKPPIVRAYEAWRLGEDILTKEW